MPSARPLPFLSSMVEDCIGRGKSVQEGGAVYNFTGPQGFGIANMTDGLLAVRKLVYEDKSVSMAELRDALRHNFGQGDAAADVRVCRRSGDRRNLKRLCRRSWPPVTLYPISRFGRFIRDW